MVFPVECFFGFGVVLVVSGTLVWDVQYGISGACAGFGFYVGLFLAIVGLVGFLVGLDVCFKVVLGGWWLPQAVWFCCLVFGFCW